MNKKNLITYFYVYSTIQLFINDATIKITLTKRARSTYLY